MRGTPSADWFRRIFELLDQGVVLLRGERIVQANPSFARLVGVSADETEGQDLVEFISVDEREDMMQRLRDGASEPFPSLLKPALGDSVPVRVRLHPFEEDRDWYSVLVFRDMRSELDRLDQRRRSTPEEEELERLRATDRFKTHLLNTAAHELNTPITPLRLQTHLLNSGALGELSEKQKRAVGILDRNVQRISLLVKDVLDVARMDAGNLKVETRPTDVDALLDDVFESFVDTAEQVRIQLERRGTRGLAVEADPDRLIQVLYNLISNALKFTPAHGTIAVSTVRDDGNVRIDVTDSGVGLSQEQIDMLFKPFSQAHDPKDFAATGTGLGLYISRGIVEAHGGVIKCASDGHNKGSTFTVTLPESDAAPADRSSATGSQPPKFERKDAMMERLRELI